jgi:hypothetical protein
MTKSALKIIGGVIGVVVALYLVVVAIKYVCFGRSHEGRPIPPGTFETTVE